MRASREPEWKGDLLELRSALATRREVCPTPRPVECSVVAGERRGAVASTAAVEVGKADDGARYQAIGLEDPCGCGAFEAEEAR